MVYFYQSQPEGSLRSYQVVTGKDKFENDLLIKWGYRELGYVWFHVDNYSSGHIYLKLFADEKSIADVPQEVVNDCLQLCKSESIQGNKMSHCTILCTPWHNLRKSKDFKPGEVSFKSLQRCQKLVCHGRDQKLLNRLAKTRVELFEDVEETLHRAKKTKDGDFFLNYIQVMKERLLEEEKERKRLKKLSKKREISRENIHQDV
ncbi:hypothetical protein HG535_0D00820 [Zygotorulaspora mrakii]|uniref:NFACT RNA-binding domain-containing protein n=1 Tax=Zygotorulaspora mrakii TaxID=42260 RepID=A0A7H9B125_ZYGMR|nr:uncharacterized protein HG535_0D00820 [Zygotorulaspora mrakii]QLG72375.1 hypothetical protein HG535_0D00820 [Zygotorulaspora mrakii]